MKISLIIPVNRAIPSVSSLVDVILEQTKVPDEIILINVESGDEAFKSQQYSSRTHVSAHAHSSSVKVINIKKEEFDHGRTRDIAFRQSTGDFVIFLTKDALPANNVVIENLIAPLLKDSSIAISTGRQLPKADATVTERLVRNFNYPATSHIRSKQDIPAMGIKTFFCSDVCAAYRRDVYFELGGFDYPIKTNEDMFFAAKAINAGYKIAYVAEAEVFHSHNLSLKEQYKRNYTMGYEIERHKEILNDTKGMNDEGFKLVKFVSKELLKQGRIFSLIWFGFDCCARLLGNKLGKKKCREKKINEAYSR